jgi:hypothetical protein
VHQAFSFNERGSTGRVRLDAEDDEVGVPHSCGVVTARSYTQSVGDFVAMGRRSRGCHDVLGLHLSSVNESTNKRPSHRSTAQDGNLPAHSAATSSASCTALRAAPLRKLSAAQKNTRPLPAEDPSYS